MSRQPGRRRAPAMTPVRLGVLLGILFVALAVPAAALVWLGFRQLDLESLRQQQLAAQTFVDRIDRQLANAIARESVRPASEYTFAVVDPDAGVLQRSPLASVGAGSDVPGLIGYFQVDAGGLLSTPLLPAEGDIDRYGLREGDGVPARRTVIETLTAVLADNRLVDRGVPAVFASGDDTAAALEERLPDSAVAERVADSAGMQSRRLSPVSAESALLEADTVSGFESADRAARGQAAFDRLAEDAGVVAIGRGDSAVAAPGTVARTSGQRAESAAPAEAQEDQAAAGAPAGGAAEPVVMPVRVSAFDGELEPFVFNRLDTGHFVLFRNAWRDGSRLVQGMLLDDARFLAGAVLEPFEAAGFAPGVRLRVGFDGDAAAAASPDTRTIMRARLAPPLAGIALEFAAEELPPSPVRSVLVWSALALFVVLSGGIYAIYRFGAQQIALARQQRTFVSAVTHELKTPLTSIRMYSEMLREGWASDEKKREYYDFISAESERLSRLIDNVLALARIERGGRPAPEILTVGEVLDMIRSKVAGAVAAAGFTLTAEADPAVGTRRIRVDPDSLAQIFINLVDNALKFSVSAERREIVLSAHARSDGRVVLRVRDFGPGLDSKDLERLFELFYRPDTELTRSVAGTGIGLALVRQLADEIGGTVDAASASPGAAFSVVLPAVDS